MGALSRMLSSHPDAFRDFDLKTPPEILELCTAYLISHAHFGESMASRALHAYRATPDHISVSLPRHTEDPDRSTPGAGPLRGVLQVAQTHLRHVAHHLQVRPASVLGCCVLTLWHQP
jgi:hypothetical protein